MDSGPQILRIDPKSQESNELTEVDLAELGLRERADLQEWISNNPGILGDDLLLVGKEFSDFEGARERPDLLAVETDGKLVVIELKRDDSGADVHWQAIRYASYFSHAKADQVVGIFARYRGISESDAETDLLKHLNVESVEDLNARLNHDQRLILASHRFAPEVTTAVLWLNEKATNENLITCVQLTPYRDARADSLYLQASTIIPVPGIDVVRIGKGQPAASGRNPNADDGVTHFVRRVEELAMDGLPAEMSPDKASRWAGSYYDSRWYNLRYLRAPWIQQSSGYGTYYQILLTPVDVEDEVKRWKASVLFRHARRSTGEVAFELEDILRGIGTHQEWQIVNDRDISADLGTGALNEELAHKMATVLRELIETITPIVDCLQEGPGYPGSGSPGGASQPSASPSSSSDSKSTPGPASRPRSQ